MDLSFRFIHIYWLIDNMYNAVVIVMAVTLYYFLDKNYQLSFNVYSITKTSLDNLY